MCQRLDDPGVGGLQSKLMHRHTTHPDTRVADRTVDQGTHDVDGERVSLAGLAAYRVHRVAPHKGRGVAKCVLERLAAAFVSEVIHEGDTRCPHPRVCGGRALNERRYRPGTVVEKQLECLLALMPRRRSERLKVSRTRCR
jgi:hypothetical protein